MKRLIALVLAALTALAGLLVVANAAQATASQCDAVAGNLVHNCGFETGDLIDWTESGFNGATNNSLYVHSGGWGGYLGTEHVAGTLSQTLAGTTPGATYTFSYWMEVADGLSFAVRVSNVVGGPLTFDAMGVVVYAPWTQYTHTFTTRPDGTPPTITFQAQDDLNYWGVDDVVVTPAPPTKKPLFTSADQATFTVGASRSVTVSTKTDAAHGTATLSCASCSLPSGVTFTPGADGTATIAGNPAVGTGGSYPLTITATNTVGSTKQSFSLVVNESPALLGSGGPSFVVGKTTSFTYTASGYPGPISIALAPGSSLPSGLSLGEPVSTTNGHGRVTTSVVLSGDPAVGTGGYHFLDMVATNGIGQSYTRAIQLIVYAPPRFTSADHATFVALQNNSFQVTTDGGFPSNGLTFSESGALPPGVTLNSSGLLSGSPAVSASGYWPVMIKVSNSERTSSTQRFTLFVQAPAVPAGALSDPGGLSVTTLSASGECISWPLTGFAPYAPVTLIGYVTRNHAVPVDLGTYSANPRGRVTVRSCLPDSARGAYTLLAAGYASGSTVRYREARAIVQP